MRIAIDTQPLLEAEKTGIGFMQAGLVKAMMKRYPGNTYYFNYHTLRHGEEKTARLSPYARRGGVLVACAWMHERIYRMIWNFLPFPYRWVFKQEAEVTHFYNYHVPPGVRGKVMTTVHDLTYKTFPQTMRWRTRIMLDVGLKRSCARADKILTISEFSKGEIERYLHIPSDRIVVAPCGVNHAVFFPVTDPGRIKAVREKHTLPERYFLYLGTLEPRKNLERLIDGYALLLKRDPTAPALVLAGRRGWLYESIFQRMKDNQVQNRVIFTGYVDNEDAPVLISGAVGFVFPSLYEGFGMPPAEAMACGTPVLVSRAASLPEVVGDAGLLCDPYDPEDIARQLYRLHTDEALRAELSRKGIERAKLFTWDRAAEIVMRAYQEMCPSFEDLPPDRKDTDE